MVVLPQRRPAPRRRAIPRPADEAATLARDNGLPVTRVQALVALGDLHDGDSGLAAAQTAFTGPSSPPAAGPEQHRNGMTRERRDAAH